MKAKIMVVRAPSQQERLWKLLAGQDVEIFLAPNFQEAKKELSGPGSYDLVFADAELPDGSWRDLLQLLIDSSRHCELIVCSRVGDERLWAEVLQCGAFDLISEPYEEQEVLRIAQSAMDFQYMQKFVRSTAS